MEYIFLVSLGWFLVEFEPLAMLINYLNEKTGRKAWFIYIIELVTCWKCATFWSSLLLTFDIKTAVIASFIAFIAENVIERWIQSK